jgi:hypothetical protein
MSKSDSTPSRGSTWVMRFLIKTVVRAETYIPDPGIPIIHRKIDKSIRLSLSQIINRRLLKQSIFGFSNNQYSLFSNTRRPFHRRPFTKKSMKVSDYHLHLIINLRLRLLESENYRY